MINPRDYQPGGKYCPLSYEEADKLQCEIDEKLEKSSTGRDYSQVALSTIVNETMEIIRPLLIANRVWMRRSEEAFRLIHFD